MFLTLLLVELGIGMFFLSFMLETSNEKGSLLFWTDTYLFFCFFCCISSRIMWISFLDWLNKLRNKWVTVANTEGLVDFLNYTVYYSTSLEKYPNGSLLDLFTLLASHCCDYCSHYLMVFIKKVLVKLEILEIIINDSVYRQSQVLIELHSHVGQEFFAFLQRHVVILLNRVFMRLFLASICFSGSEAIVFLILDFAIVFRND